MVVVSAARVHEAVEVLCDAFFDYPVMRFVIGDTGATYASRLHSLIAFFTMARVLNDDLVLGVENAEGRLIAAANVTRPGERTPAPELGERREALWQELGADARSRHEALGAIWRTFRIEPSHYHLNMIGVRRAHQGRGAARRLLEAVRALSAGAPESCGVTLSTELPGNVPLYQYFGYKVIGHGRIPGIIETWGFFRPDSTN